MSEDWRRLIESIHAAPIHAVIVVTGGGATAISELLTVPGGSRTILAAAVPYSAAALIEWLGRVPEQFCSEETALQMATVAFEHGRRLSAVEHTRNNVTPSSDKGDAGLRPEVDREVVGISCTASLVSDRPKRGPHRCFVAAQGIDFTASLELDLEKGARDRIAEERLVAQVILTALGRAADLEGIPPLPLRSGEELGTRQIAAHWLLLDLIAGRRKVVWSLPDGKFSSNLAVGQNAGSQSPTADAAPDVTTFSAPRGVLCGAFNPLHYGHEQLRGAAERILAGPVYYEVSLKNVDKPPLDFLTIEHRRGQFVNHLLALTVAPTFAEKSDALPGATFVVGIDTAERIVEPHYYGDSEKAMRQSLSHLRDRGCRFLVAGRKLNDRFRALSDIHVPAEFTDLFSAIPPSAFRADVSSTELRQKAP